MGTTVRTTGAAREAAERSRQSAERYSTERSRGRESDNKYGQDDKYDQDDNKKDGHRKITTGVINDGRTGTSDHDRAVWNVEFRICGQRQVIDGSHELQGPPGPVFFHFHHRHTRHGAAAPVMDAACSVAPVPGFTPRHPAGRRRRA
jgi:hypothetical protein